MNQDGKPSCALYLGMPKTATTMIQHDVFMHHSGVAYLGKAETIPRFPHPDFEAVVFGLLRWQKEAKPRTCQAAANHVRQLQQSGQKVILSEEAFTGGKNQDRRRQAERFHEIFGESSIVFSIREPISFIEALYFQELKGFQFKPSRYRNCVKNFGHPPRYFDINQWLESIWDPAAANSLSHLSIYDTAAIYADVFGKHNVHVMKYEGLRQNPETYLTELSHCIGIDPEESIRLGSKKSKNVRWSDDTLKRLKNLESSPLKRLFFRWFCNTNYQRRMLGMQGPLRDKASPRAAANLSPEWKSKILEIARPQYRKLAAAWNLSLTDYGNEFDVEQPTKPSSKAA